MGTALCCRESPSHWEPAQVCYKALISAKPTGRKAHGHMTALPRPGLTVPITAPPSSSLRRDGGNKPGGLSMSSDNGVKPGVKTTPRRPGPQGRARAGQGWGHVRGRWWPVTLAWGSWQLLAASSCSCWPRGWSWATGPGAPRQASRCPRAPGGLGERRGALAEEGGMVWRKSRKIQHRHPGDCGGGERGTLGRHLSLVHREERDTIYKAVRL